METEVIKKIIAQKLGCSVAEIKYETNFLNDLGADSFDMTEIQMEFESRIGCNISDNEIDRVKTFKDLVELIERKINETH